MSTVKEKSSTRKTAIEPKSKAEEPIVPVFEQVEGMTQGAALNVVLQAAEMAQNAGALTIRDSVLLAKAISVLRPGSI